MPLAANRHGGGVRREMAERVRARASPEGQGPDPGLHRNPLALAPAPPHVRLPLSQRRGRIEVLSRLLGHASVTTTERHAALFEPNVRAEVERVRARKFGQDFGQTL